ncbi:hypothetical protein K435DRAFT_845809, partial [Dendrothele bispora CBS 962.96]
MASTRPSNPDFVSESPVRTRGVQRRHSWDATANVRAHTTSSSPPNVNSDNSTNPLRAMFNESRNTRFTRSTVNNVGGDDRRHIYNLRFQNIRANISGNANITLNFGQVHLAQPIPQEKNILGGIALGL